MNYIKQRFDECHLATLCMLKGLTQDDYNIISDWCKKYVGYPFSYDRTRKEAMIFVNTLLCFDTRFTLGYHSVNLTGLQWNAITEDDIDLSGKGMLVIMTEDKKSGHAVAFENNIIFDPSHRGETTFSGIKERYKTWVRYYRIERE